VVKRIEIMDCHSFPLRVDMVHHMATRILHQRENSKALSLGKYWITRFLNKHTYLASKFSIQVKKQRIVSYDPKILRQAFDVLDPFIRQFHIKAQNLYNIYEKGLQMGKSPRVKVICVRSR